MPTYVTLVNFTEQGVKTFKDLPSRLPNLERIVQQAGGKITGWYLTMGQYDLVVIGEFPDDETATRVVLTIGAQGNGRTTTLRAFTRPEAEAIARSLP